MSFFFFCNYSDIFYFLVVDNSPEYRDPFISHFPQNRIIGIILYSCQVPE